jgi:hypothetical protein
MRGNSGLFGNLCICTVRSLGASRVTCACSVRGLDSATGSGIGEASRGLRSVVEPLNLVRPIDRTADHLNGRSYFCSGASRCHANTASCNVAQSVKTPAPFV